MIGLKKTNEIKCRGTKLKEFFFKKRAIKKMKTNFRKKKEMK